MAVTISTAGCAYSMTTAFAGLDHLNTLDLSILADGVVQTSQTIGSGTITISNAAIVNIGLPFTSDIETLNIDFDTKLGSMQGRHYKIGQVTLRLLNSIGGFIGPDEDSLYESFTETYLAGEPELLSSTGLGTKKLYNVDVKVPLGASYEVGGKIFVRQTDPLPITISAIVPDVVL